jgi:adenylylsulfate kinase
MKILIMGLPGSGKTTLAKKLVAMLDGYVTVTWLNADEIRAKYDDWDFSPAGRIRQATRMRRLADESPDDVVVCDFIAALDEQREIFDADFTIWMDTIPEGRYADTNAAFEEPEQYDWRVTKW